MTEKAKQNPSCLVRDIYWFVVFYDALLLQSAAYVYEINR